MSFRRVGWLAATALASLLWMSCGEVYRPVVIPISAVPPNPQNFHAVFGLNANVGGNPGTVLQVDVSGDSNIGVANMGLVPTHAAALPNNSRIFVASAGTACVEDPSLCFFGAYPAGTDVVTAFSPAADSPIATGIGNTTTYSLPNVGPQQSSPITSISEAGNVVTLNLSTAIGQAQVGDPISIAGVVIPGTNPSAYDGNFTISAVTPPGTIIQFTNAISGLPNASGGTATVPVPTFCSYQPDFVATAQNNAVFVANYGVERSANVTPNCQFASTDSVALLSTTNSSITNIAYLNPSNSSPAPHPVAMVETPNGQNLYVVNEGNNTVMDLSPTDLSTLATIPVGNTPVWAAARPDNRRVYVLAQGSGTLVPIDVASNTILSSQTNLTVGAGASFFLYDPSLNRLYVPYPGTAANNYKDSAVYVYSATGGVDSTGTANDTPSLLATIPMAVPTTLNPNAPCPTGCSPISIAALPDGSRFYVASYETQASCSDSDLVASACIIPMVTVFDAASLTVKPPAQTLLPSSPSLSLLTSPPFTLTQYAVAPAPACATPTPYAPGDTRFRIFTTASEDGSHVYVSMCDAGSIADIATSTNSITTATTTPDLLMTDINAPFGACTPGTCGSVATITSFSIASNVVTFTANNTFVAGEQVQIAGLGVGTYLNGQSFTVLPAGLSGTQFESNFTHPDVALTTDSGTAVGVPTATITSFSINNDIATFQAVNTFTPGTKVGISGFTSTAGTQINGLTVTVLGVGLTSTQFEVNLNLVPAPANVGPTTDTGTAVPIVQPQSPIFLLTGQ